MKIEKQHYLLGLIFTSAYLLQRALLVLVGRLDLRQQQEQPQAEGSLFGFQVSFSYLGMSIYWPLIVAGLFCWYRHAKLPPSSEGPSSSFEKRKSIRRIFTIGLPLLALTLHFVSITDYSWKLGNDTINVLLGEYRDANGKSPSFPTAVGAGATLILLLVSFVISLGLVKAGLSSKAFEED